MKLAKKYAESIKSYDRSKSYDLPEACKIVVDTAKAKFDETIELHVRLGVDPRQADQQVRGVLVLPNGTGKQKKVLVVAKGDKADAATAAGADYVGAEEMIQRILRYPPLFSHSQIRTAENCAARIRCGSCRACQRQ